jgi:hypothetical protein
LDLAKKSGFTWDEGLIHLELARTLRPDALERRAHLEQARRLFEKVGSLHDLERVGALDV